LLWKIGDNKLGSVEKTQVVVFKKKKTLFGA